MENALQVRDIKVITSEIKELRAQAQNVAVAFAVEIGRRLVEAKAALPHGEWGQWLKDEVEFSQSSANNFMKIFEEYGDRQLTLFGAITKSQTIGNLPYSKALQLLAIPADEREEFAENVDAENLSVKELQVAIKERNEAVRRADELQKAADEADSARKDAEMKAAKADELQKRVDELNADLQSAQQATVKAKEQLKNAKANPKLPPERLKEIEEAAERTAKAQAALEMDELIKKAKAELDGALEAKKAADASAAQAIKALEEAKKRLKTANPEITRFKTIFESMQEQAGKLAEIIQKAPEDAPKLRAALNAFAEKLKSV